MYDTFKLRETKEAGNLVGYSWQLPDPDKIVLIVHGLGELAGRYDRVCGFLNRVNIAAVSMDVRGHGLSGGPRGHCAPRKDILGDVDAMFEYAMDKYPDKPLILYGHSLGGNIALDYRSRGAYNALPLAYAISAPWLLLKKPPSGILRALVAVLSRIAPSMTIKSAIDEGDLGHPDVVKPYLDHPLVHDKISLLAAMEALTIGEALANGKHGDNGRAAGIPMLLMHGTEDKICDIEGSRRFVASHPGACTFIPWESMFHEIHNGNREVKGDEVISRMVAWMLDPRAPQTTSAGE